MSSYLFPHTMRLGDAGNDSATGLPHNINRLLYPYHTSSVTLTCSPPICRKVGGPRSASLLRSWAGLKASVSSSESSECLSSQHIRFCNPFGFESELSDMDPSNNVDGSQNLHTYLCRPLKLQP